MSMHVNVHTYMKLKKKVEIIIILSDGLKRW